MTASNIQAQVNDLSSDLMRIEIEEFEATAARQECDEERAGLTVEDNTES